MESARQQKLLTSLDRIIDYNLLFIAFFSIFSLGIVQFFIVISVLALLYRLFQEPAHAHAMTFLDLAVWLFFLSRLISIPISVDISLSLGSLRKTPFDIMVYFLLSRHRRFAEKDQLQKFFRTLVIAAVLVSLYGSFKYVLGLQARITSTVSGYTTLAIYLSAVFAFTLGAGFYFQLLKQKVYWMLSLGLMLLGLAFTFARAQWIATAAVILIAAFIKNRKLIPITIAAIIILLFTSANLRNRALTLLNPVKHSSERTIIYRGAWEIFPDRCWFGHGIGSFKKIFPLRDTMQDQGVGRWHNDYLQAFMESGCFGLLIYLFLILALYKTGFAAYRRLREQGDIFRQGLIFGILLALTTFFIQGFASGFFGDPISTILFWIFVGSLAQISRQPPHSYN
ncbi:O-antigen ligase family protein [candidate division KSB1 bacterium]|nr:O-antigen ligase family protein [candidate division KSB1 bacterium]